MGAVTDIANSTLHTINGIQQVTYSKYIGRNTDRGKENKIKRLIRKQQN